MRHAPPPAAQLGALLALALLAGACASPASEGVREGAADRQARRGAGGRGESESGAVDETLVAATLTELDRHLARIDEVLELRRQPELAEMVAPALRAARGGLESFVDDLRRDFARNLDAMETGAEVRFRDTGYVEAAARTAVAAVAMLDEWNALAEMGRTIEIAEPEEVRSVLREQHARLRDALLAAAASRHSVLAQTRAVSLTVLFEGGRDDDAARELVRGWRDGSILGAEGLDEEWPHRLAREWSGSLAGSREALGAVLRAGHPLVPATIGFLSLSAALAAEDAGDAGEAVRLYEEGLAAFSQVTEGDAVSSEWDVAVAVADCGVNAARLRRERALAALAGDDPAAGLAAAREELLRAEQDDSAALAALPHDEDAAKGLVLTADIYYQADDLEGARDAFGRLARRFDRAEWWNNHALFCRDTGLYEESLAAYERCLELAPDDPRYLNDTGLILLYHLDRDLVRAEALFRRAWELGRAAHDNPFASEDERTDSFLAYTDAMLNLALLQARGDRLAEAQAVVDELLALSPEREDARRLASDIRRAAGAPPGSTP